MNSTLLKYGLLAGVAYFCCMAIAHYFGIKWPLLFVYYDTPFYAYQDKIISFAVTAYAGLFYVAAQNRTAVPVALGVLAITILGLSSVNVSGDLAEVLAADQTTQAYWLQTGLFTVYFLVLTVLHIRDRRAD